VSALIDMTETTRAFVNYVPGKLKIGPSENLDPPFQDAEMGILPLK